jgi:hypothetical protein
MTPVKGYLGFVLVLAACGGAAMQTVKIVNTTNRTIDELYVYPVGAANQGSSRGTLAPNASTEVQVRSGFVEVKAVSAKLQVDEHTRDRPTASQDLEIKGPVQVIFYDADHTPPGLDRPGVFGIAFVIPVAKKPEPDPSEGAP